MKKALALAMILVMILSAVSFPAYADGSVALTISGGTANIGEDVTVTVTLTSNPGIAGVGAHVSFDTEKLAYKSVKNLGTFPGTFVGGKARDGHATFSLAYVSDESKTRYLIQFNDSPLRGVA